ncbi:MAG: type II toxin-antitoxin system VapC family toxin [Myxococcota bacterium]
MTGWLLDTNVLSELRKPRPHPGVVSFVQDKPLEALFISTVTLAEIRYGIALAPEQGKRLELEQWLDTRMRPMFEGRVLPIDEAVMVVWRMLVDSGRKRGHTFSQPDLIIAATAKHHTLTLVSRNTRDYVQAEITTLNPWDT